MAIFFKNVIANFKPISLFPTDIHFSSLSLWHPKKALDNETLDDYTLLRRRVPISSEIWSEISKYKILASPDNPCTACVFVGWFIIDQTLPKHTNSYWSQTSTHKNRNSPFKKWTGTTPYKNFNLLYNTKNYSIQKLKPAK